jgi:hypothetical protein
LSSFSRKLTNCCATTTTLPNTLERSSITLKLVSFSLCKILLFVLLHILVNVLWNFFVFLIWSSKYFFWWFSPNWKPINFDFYMKLWDWKKRNGNEKGIKHGWRALSFIKYAFWFLNFKNHANYTISVPQYFSNSILL